MHRIGKSRAREIAVFCALATVVSGTEPASAAITGTVTLPVVLVADDAISQQKATVQPMLKAPVDILGARKIHFRSVAQIVTPVSFGQKHTAVTVSSSDTLAKYAISSGGVSFTAYCKGFPSRPVAGLICFADRDSNGDFDQVWIGSTSNPRLGVPSPLIKLQEAAFTALPYAKKTGPVPSSLKFGFSITSAGGLANKRELHIQITDGVEKSYIFYSRINGPTAQKSVATTVLDCHITLYGDDSKTVTYSIEKPFSQSVYSISDVPAAQNVWIYIPG